MINKNNILVNLKSGFILFLIALPLSIGIALASNAPATAGLWSAIIGGMLGSILGGAEININGPAAGLIVVVLDATIKLSQFAPSDPLAGFKFTLAAIVIAGIFQIILGLLKLADLGLVLPSAVIHGMLSAIGAIIIAKQIPVLLGVKAISKTIIGLYLEIPHEIQVLNPAITLIGLTSFFILFFSNSSKKTKWIKKIPIPLIVVIIGIIFNRIFDLEHEHLVHIFHKDALVNANYLLNIPSNFSASIYHPDFHIFLTKEFFIAVISILFVSTIESVLSTVAVDKLDPQKRTSNLNRDLMSKGVCNMILGFIGGLPVITEIVRSTANIENGATSRLSNFFHGFFILLFLLLFPNILHQIPLAAMAAILIFVGYKLAHPSHFKHVFEIGTHQFLAFITTFIVTLATDLLIGVLAGLLIEVFIALLKGVPLSQFFSINYKIKEEKENTTLITIESHAIFSGFLSIKKELDKALLNKKNLILDFQNSNFIDHNILDQINNYKFKFEANKLNFEMFFAKEHKAISMHPLATRFKN
jgi:MFS superfamily sulfate permease-like transporter